MNEKELLQIDEAIEGAFKFMRKHQGNEVCGEFQALREARVLINSKIGEPIYNFAALATDARENFKDKLALKLQELTERFNVEIDRTEFRPELDMIHVHLKNLNDKGEQRRFSIYVKDLAKYL